MLCLGQKDMKFEFKNLGPIYRGEIELADLTVLCGKNNTGKTYITNSIYSFFQNWVDLIEWDLPDEIEADIRHKGVTSIDLEQKIINKLDIKKAMRNLAHNLSNFFACSPDLFKDAKLGMQLKFNEDWIDEEFNARTSSPSGDVFLTIKKPKGSKIAEIAWLDDDSAPPLFLLEDIVKKHLFQACLKFTFSDVFIASAERTGAAIFRNELNFNKNQLVSFLAEAEKNGNKKINPFDIVRSFKRTYAQSVEHNVDFISYRIETLVKMGQSDFIKENQDLLAKFQEIAGGIYKYHKDTGVYFQPNGAKGVKLGLGEASSAVRSLMIIWFWLNHVAKPSALLMIDEPELNLHPENQRKFAKFVAALINAGIKVFMTTHSDYIIRELNTLVMLSCDKSHIAQVREKFKYNENDFIKPESIAVYNTTEDLFTLEGSRRRKKMGTIERWDVVESFGIKIQSFDEEIREMNKVQDALLYGV